LQAALVAASSAVLVVPRSVQYSVQLQKGVKALAQAVS
jgi:hypothetical protein